MGAVRQQSRTSEHLVAGPAFRGGPRIGIKGRQSRLGLGLALTLAALLAAPAVHAIAAPGGGKGATFTIGFATLSPLAALIAGILILFVPRLLNYIVALYFIVVGLLGLSGR